MQAIGRYPYFGCPIVEHSPLPFDPATRPNSTVCIGLDPGWSSPLATVTLYQRGPMDWRLERSSQHTHTPLSIALAHAHTTARTPRPLVGTEAAAKNHYAHAPTSLADQLVILGYRIRLYSGPVLRRIHVLRFCLEHRRGYPRLSVSAGAGVVIDALTYFAGSTEKPGIFICHTPSWAHLIAALSYAAVAITRPARA